MSRVPELVPTYLPQLMRLSSHSHTQLQLPQQDKFFPSSGQLTCFVLLLRKLVLPLYLAGSFSSFSSQHQHHFLKKWCPNPKQGPLVYVFIALKTFPFHSPCFVITHLIVFPPLTPPSLLLYKLQQCRNHIQLLFTLYPGPSPAPNPQNALNKYL